MMVANIEGLAGFTKRNRRSCEIFYARRKNTLGPRLVEGTPAYKNHWL